VAKETEIQVMKVEVGELHCYILGRTPLILNRMSEKARGQLLLPHKKNAAERAGTLKHNPLEEFRASPYLDRNPNGPTLLQHLATAFKGAMRGAALDIPGATKSQIGRLTYIQGEYVSIYGVPKLLMSVTRSADINRTPDIRTRCIVPQWACELTLQFMKPILTPATVGNLLSAAGLTQGVGDWRPEKGSGTYGQFELVAPDDSRWIAVRDAGGRAAQQEAMEHPECYDSETQELLEWFDGQLAKR